MSKKRGNLSLRIEDTEHGQTAQIVYRGDKGKQPMTGVYPLDLSTTVDKTKLQELVTSIWRQYRLPIGTSD